MQALNFLKETRAELEKVVWPTPAQTIKLTIMVIMVTLVSGALIGGVDYLLTLLTTWLFNR